MTSVVMYMTSWCGFCARARRLLNEKNAQVIEFDIDRDPGLRAEMMQKSGRRTVPQIWIGDEHIGGCDDLFALERSGQLDKKLQGRSE